jgi:MFS family permease
LPCRTIFLVGILPAFVALWIRRAVPEPEEWRDARAGRGERTPGVRDLFRGPVRRTTILTILVCGFSLSGHWAFMFWFMQHLRRLPEVMSWSDADKTRLASQAMILVVVASTVGNFLAGWAAQRMGYRKTIAAGCVLYFLLIAAAYSGPVDHATLIYRLAPIGMCQGLFALFTMYVPPLFPTLLRTTGAGFCYNIGRIAAAGATVLFGMSSPVGDHRLAILFAGTLFLPAAALVMWLTEPPDEMVEEGERGVGTDAASGSQ